MGHESVVIHDISVLKKKPSIYLKEKPEELAEVIVEPDPWSRKKKLQIFRREFLGNSTEAKKCRIKNEEAIDLHYSPSREVLTAEAREPLIIINRFLGYELEYELSSFRVEFSTGTSGLQLIYLVYYAGSSYFKELNKRPRKTILENRRYAYLGSSLHFMRSLAGKELAQNDFRIFHDRFEAPPYEYFKIKDNGELAEVQLLSEKLSILYRDIQQSGLKATTPFFIDAFGNHTPPNAIMLSGEMSGKRLAFLLPLNYDPEK